jgi:hypothetical protein
MSFKVRFRWSKKAYDLPKEWRQIPSADIAFLFRMYKSLFCYVRGFALYNLALGQIENDDRQSGAVNAYYSLLHLAIAALDLVPEHEFDISQEILFPDGTNLSAVQRARLTPLTHSGTVEELLGLGKEYPSLGRIGTLLKESVEIREGFSYGPWIQGTIVSGRWPIEPVHFDVQSIFLRRYLGILKKPRQFTPLGEMVGNMIKSTGELIHEYPGFLAACTNKRERYDRQQFKALLFDALVQAPYTFYPYVPSKVWEETKKVASLLIASLGEWYAELIDPVSKLWSNETYLKSLKAGALLSYRMRIDTQPPEELHNH